MSLKSTFGSKKGDTFQHLLNVFEDKICFLFMELLENQRSEEQTLGTTNQLSTLLAHRRQVTVVSSLLSLALGFLWPQMNLITLKFICENKKQKNKDGNTEEEIR